MPFSVFISYSHRDRELRQELDKHLSNLKRQNVITSWFDGDIIPRTEWKSQIIKHLNTDQIILLLISADFMASDFCYSIEMAQAIARHNANQARVLPIILRPTDWKGAPFDKLKVLPTDGRADATTLGRMCRTSRQPGRSLSRSGTLAPQSTLSSPSIAV